MAESLQYVVARGNPVWEIDCDQKMTKFVNTLMIHFVHIRLFGKDWLFIDKTASKLRNVKSLMNSMSILLSDSQYRLTEFVTSFWAALSTFFSDTKYCAEQHFWPLFKPFSSECSFFCHKSQVSLANLGCMH